MKLLKIVLKSILFTIIASLILIGSMLLQDSANTLTESNKAAHPKAFTTTNINPKGIVISHINKDSTYTLIIQPKDTQVEVSKHLYELIKNKDTIK